MSPVRRLTAELIGTALLLAIVVGSGIMGERLAGGNAAIALLGNSLATGAGLIVLIHMFGPVSGAHFNPVVSLAVFLGRQMNARTAIGYVLAQFAGAVLGVWLAHLMFGLPIVQLSSKLRPGFSQMLSEGVATLGLIGTILSTQRRRPEVTPVAVGLYISAAYWFTASTSFANPAVTLARSLTDTFAGIAPSSAPLFIVGQLAGALAGLGLFGWLYRQESAA
jgi:glycerol uptake facilitator-like aquaporin